MSFNHDLLNYVVIIYADQNTGNPDLIIIGEYEFNGPDGAILATNKLLLGLRMLPSTPYGIFEPSGIIEVAPKDTYGSSRRFYFEPIDYLHDSVESTLTQLGIRFEKLINWRQIVLNQ